MYILRTVLGYTKQVKTNNSELDSALLLVDTLIVRRLRPPSSSLPPFRFFVQPVSSSFRSDEDVNDQKSTGEKERAKLVTSYVHFYFALL